MKKTYEKPLSELYEIQPEGALLYGSAETMKTVNGYWEDDDE